MLRQLEELWNWPDWAMSSRWVLGDAKSTLRAIIDDSDFCSVEQIVTGSSTPSLKNLRKTLNLPRPLKFDMIFIDHLKVFFSSICAYISENLD